MFKISSFLLAFMFTVYTIPANAQKNLAIIDKAGFMNTTIEDILTGRLREESVNLTPVIDTRNRCDYIYATLVMAGPDLQLSVTDCNNKTAGTKNLGSRIMTGIDTEKALLLYFALSEMLKQPLKDAGRSVPQATGTMQDSLFTADPGHHRSRYFFAPSSYNLEKGEIYYNSLYFLLHDVQYGVTNQFSMGMGTTILGFPFYLTPKITIPVSSRSAFAIGDMLMLGTWGARFTGNLAYTTFTTGGDYNNITFGAGYLHVGGADITDRLNLMLINVSALLRISPHVYFITENYGSDHHMRQVASSYDYNTGTSISNSFSRNIFFIYGLTGFRFINRNNDIKSWQFGLSYIFTSRDNVPGAYQYSGWYIEKRSRSNLTAFPVVGYARKFPGK